MRKTIIGFLKNSVCVSMLVRISVKFIKCLGVCVAVCPCLHIKARRGHQDPWSRSNKHLQNVWLLIWVLGSKLGPPWLHSKSTYLLSQLYSPKLCMIREIILDIKPQSFTKSSNHLFTKCINKNKTTKWWSLCFSDI